MDFTRNPAAPARSARSTYWSASKVVSTTTTGGESSLLIRSIAVIPSTPGMRRSMSTTSAGCAQRLDPGRAVVGLVDDLDTGVGSEDRAQVRADHRLVVDDHDLHDVGHPAAPVAADADGRVGSAVGT